MELHSLVTPAAGVSPEDDSSNFSWYTKDLMVEETSSPVSSPHLSGNPSPCDSTASSPLGDLRGSGLRTTPPLILTPSQPLFSLPLSRARVSSSSSLLPTYCGQTKRKRSISDSLVPIGKKETEEARDEEELDLENSLSTDEFGDDAHGHQDDAPEATTAGTEDDDEESDDPGVDASPRAARLQGHESGPPSPPVSHYQHGMNENPDGTAYYHCKFCQQTWPQHHFRNAQQFGAHCSNCSRKRKVKDPQDMTTTTRERNKRMRKHKRGRSNSASKASFDETRHKLISMDEDTAQDPSSQGSKARKFKRPAYALPPLARRSPAAFHSSSSDEDMAGMERLCGAVARKHETLEASPRRNTTKNSTKSIYALLAYVKAELARLNEKQDSEELEQVSREMVQDTRTEWEARIQELRVESASDLRAHSAALPRRLSRLAALHPHHAELQTGSSDAFRSSLGFILNDSPTTVPAAPPPSPLPPARLQQREAEVLSLASKSSPANAPQSVARPAPFASSHPSSCLSVASSSLSCTSPLASPL